MTIQRGQKPNSIRQNNVRSMLNIIRSEKEITIPELAKKIGLSKTTAWKTTDYFLQNNLLVNRGKGSSGEDGGKKPELFAFNQNYGYTITIAIHGNYILCALSDAKAEIFHTEKINLKESNQLEDLVALVVQLLTKWKNPSNYLEKAQNLIGVVLAVSGVVDTQKGIVYTSTKYRPVPTNTPLLQMVKDKVKLEAPFYIDNFSRFSVYGEKYKGESGQYSDILMVHGSEIGVSAGIISDNTLRHGNNFITGEIGHMKINPLEKERCYCGGYGCLEQQISLDRLERKAKEFLPNYPDSLLNEEKELTWQAVFKNANLNDKLSMTLLDEMALWFAIALQNATVTLDPQLILIGGSYKEGGDYLINKIRESMEEVFLVDVKKSTEIEYANFGPEGALIGCSCYALNTYFDNYDPV